MAISGPISDVNNNTPSGGSPGGSPGAVQYNNDSSFGGFGNYDADSNILSLDVLLAIKEGATLVIYSPNGSKSAILSTGDNNRFTISNVDELNLSGGLRSTNYITCTDLYLTNLGTGSEIHNYVDADNVLQFVQTLGAGASANFQMSVIIDNNNSLYFTTISGKQGSLHVDDASGVMVFTLDEGYYQFQGQDVYIDNSLHVNGSVTTPSIYNPATNALFIDVENAKIYDQAATPMQFINAADRIFYDAAGQDIIDFSAFLRVAIKSAAFLDFNNSANDSSFGITNNGTAGNSICDLSGATLYRADAPIQAPDVTAASTMKGGGRVTFSGGTPTLVYGYNIASIVDDGAGNTTINFTIPFADADSYSVTTTLEAEGSVFITSRMASSFTVVSRVVAVDTDIDFNFSAMGNR